MKNISKTTKTILFASLIAAMILPFSAMDFADAAKSTEKTISKAQKIQLAINELIDRKAQSLPGEDNEQIDYQISTLKIAKKLTKLEAKGLESSPRAQKLVAKLLQKIDSKGVAVESSMSSELSLQELNMTNSRTDSFGTKQLIISCNKYVLAETTGTLTQYDTHSLWNVNADYPPTIHCDKVHHYTEIKISELYGSSLSTCSTFFFSNIDSENILCEGIGLADDSWMVNVIAVTSNAYYYDGNLDLTPFSNVAGYNLIVY